MRTQSVFFVAVLVVAAPQECSTLKGSKNAVCRDIQPDQDQQASQTESSDYPDYAYHDTGPATADREDVDGAGGTPHSDHSQPREKVVERCCAGYKDNNGTCEPLCESGCENGYCSEPNKCACNDGYEKTPMNDCVPICEEVCIRGKCIRRTCDPVCSNMTCENGYCMAENVCGCNRGYKKNARNECEPICTMPCGSGKCVAPNRCVCDVGFRFSEDNFVCEPICSQPCQFGASCTEPENCTCNDGFVMDEAENGSCVSACRPSCNKGLCTSERCVCYYGWGGILCDEPLFCVVTKSLDVSITEAQKEIEGSDLTKVANDNHQPKDEWPRCKTKCLDELNDTGRNVTLLQTTQYLIPIGSSCNVEDKLESFVGISFAIEAVIKIVAAIF